MGFGMKFGVQPKSMPSPSPASGGLRFSLSRSMPLVFFFLIITLLVYALFVILSSGVTTPFKNPVGPSVPSVLSCVDGLTRFCELGGCVGITTCLSGRWGGCQFDSVCRPGTTAPCTRDGCAYGIKMCNECGTGYGSCIPYPKNQPNPISPNQTQPST